MAGTTAPAVSTARWALNGARGPATPWRSGLNVGALTYRGAMTTSIAVDPAPGPTAGMPPTGGPADGQLIEPDPAADESRPVGDVREVRPRRPLALSPSRAGDFKTCPLLYRFRAVDRLPEPPSAPAARGTLVHSVLEQMFGRPARERTPELTAAQVGPLWEQMADANPELLGLLPAEELAGWLRSAQDLVR